MYAGSWCECRYIFTFVVFFHFLVLVDSFERKKEFGSLAKSKHSPIHSNMDESWWVTAISFPHPMQNPNIPTLLELMQFLETFP